MTEDSYRRCHHGLHAPPKPYTTHLVEVYNNPLGKVEHLFMCADCAEHRLKGYEHNFQHIVVSVVGKVRV